MLGGVTVNFILAVIIYIGMAWSYGEEYIPADSLKDGFLVTEKNIGDKLGVQTGDLILAVDGEKIEKFGALPIEIINGNTMTIQRDGRNFEQEIPVDFIATLLEDFLESIPAGIDKGVNTLTGYVKQMKKIFNPSTGAYKGVGGFAAIGGLFPDSWNWPAFWSATAFISIILAFMNILPIPALDGGHVMFLLYEMITGRKPSDKFLEYAQMTGFFLLIALLLFANGNDVYKWLFK